MVFLWKVSYATLFPSRPQWDLKYDKGERVRQRSGTGVMGRGNRRQWRKIGFHGCRGSEGTGGTGWFHLQSFVERRSTQVVILNSISSLTCLLVCFALFVVVVVVAIVFFQNYILIVSYHIKVYDDINTLIQCAATHLWSFLQFHKSIQGT